MKYKFILFFSLVTETPSSRDPMALLVRIVALPVSILESV